MGKSEPHQRTLKILSAIMFVSACLLLLSFLGARLSLFHLQLISPGNQSIMLNIGLVCLLFAVAFRYGGNNKPEIIVDDERD